MGRSRSHVAGVKGEELASGGVWVFHHLTVLGQEGDTEPSDLGNGAYLRPFRHQISPSGQPKPPASLP